MEKVSSKHHLCQRNGVFYYRRRVPTHLVDAIGKKTIQFSLGTSNLAEAKKRRAAEDLKWSTQFEAVEKSLSIAHAPAKDASSLFADPPLPSSEVIRLVQEYVERTDRRNRDTLIADPPKDRSGPKAASSR